MTSNDRYLNVQYGTLTAEVNITGISRLGGVKIAIKEALSIEVGYGLIQLYTNSNRDQLINTWALFMSLSQEYFTEGGAFVVIGTSPPPTRESSKNALFEAGVDYLITAEERKEREEELNGKYQHLLNCHTTQIRPFSNLTQITWPRLVYLLRSLFSTAVTLSMSNSSFYGKESLIKVFLVLLF